MSSDSSNNPAETSTAASEQPSVMWLNPADYQSIAARRFVEFFQKNARETFVGDKALQEEAARLVLERLEAYGSRKRLQSTVETHDDSGTASSNAPKTAAQQEVSE